MGRHSRKGPAPQAAERPAAPPAPASPPEPGATSFGEGPAGGDRPGTGRRRRSAGTAQEQYRSAGDQQTATPPYGTPYARPSAGAQPSSSPRPQVRGGHPEQREQGGAWGEAGRYGEWRGTPRAPSAPGTASAQGVWTAPRPAPGAGRAARIPGPRREFVEAFDQAAPHAPDGSDAPDAPGTADAPRTAARRSSLGTRDPRPQGAGPKPPGADAPAAAPGPGPEEEGAPGPAARGGKGRTFTGIAAAAVTTVLAVVVAGQVTDTGPDASGARSAGEAADRDGEDDAASRSDERVAPPQAAKPAAPLTYDQRMSLQVPLDAALRGSGEFQAVPGLAAAPGKGRKIRYRVDVEKGLALDGALFAEAVQKTLNDERSWAHGGAMTFERISSGEPEFVITLASPATTAVWCAKSDLDTTVDNVSCDSAATERVMINAYRWAQGSETYGDKAMYTYRQMLINHEVGHRLGHNHVSCRTPGALAPVMQQQTKSLEVDGIKCRPNPWVFPGG
ncbi:DUF3152 domain-containing protein [Streptomyces sp. SP18CS02]|uniref:DUF3152 domain-containing protein n=1 Tax=Streptomyces sp. SP18CS02 TaxID=3002531 RepID=UPI002E75A365|nr:DUF3152 domain-containing protein [Streptomyces sp. SP18CS02]MEE1757374.1 DUF3152 domain-containing protein [Streptomyces sp. SP18CS02]